MTEIKNIKVYAVVHTYGEEFTDDIKSTQLELEKMFVTYIEHGININEKDEFIVNYEKGYRAFILFKKEFYGNKLGLNFEEI